MSVPHGNKNGAVVIDKNKIYAQRSSNPLILSPRIIDIPM